MNHVAEHNRPLSSGQIDEILAPHVVHAFPPNDPNWTKMESELAARWRKSAFWSGLKRALRGNPKKVDHVKHDYTKAWTDSSPKSSDSASNAILTWGPRVFEANYFAEKAVHIGLFASVLRTLKPKRVLEVGSGNGAVAIALSRLLPDVSFVGVELTEAGVSAANALQNTDTFNSAYSELLPSGFEVGKPDQPVQFVAANAVNIPEPDKSFDVVYTSLALEQMQAVVPSVLSEIARLSKGHFVMIEPFRDFNTTPVRRDYVRAKNYLPLESSDVEQYGFAVEFTFDDFPAKVTRGAGLVVASITA